MVAQNENFKFKKGLAQKYDYAGKKGVLPFIILYRQQDVWHV